MDFTKYVSFLDSASLYLTRADCFTDPFEGYLPFLKFSDSNGEPLEQAYAQRGVSYVSCWHKSEHESEAMWKLYLKSDEGVAVKSTVSRLAKAYLDHERQKSLKNKVANFSGQLSEVKYVYQTESDPLEVPLKEVLFYKRRNFDYEKEVRLVVQHKNIVTKPSFNLPIRLKNFVVQVVVSPTSPKWFFELVRVTSQRFGFHNMKSKTRVVESSLREAPNWESVRKTGEDAIRKMREVLTSKPT